MTGDNLLVGKICALISYLAFIINGTLFRIEGLVAVSGAFGVLSLLFILPYWKGFPHYLRVMLLILVGAGVLVLVKAFFFVVAYSYLALVASGISIAIYVYKYPEFFKVRWVLSGLIAYLIIYIAAGGSAEEVYAGSRNQISTVLIAFGALALAMESRKSDMLLALLIFIACVLAVGSSGVVASAILLLATIFRQEQRAIFKVLAIAAIAASVVGFQFYLQYYASEEFTAKFSFERLTSTDVRFQIISDYFDRYTSGLFLWLGPPDEYYFYVYSEISSGGTFGYVNSLHNSYLSVHAKTGVLAAAVFTTIGLVLYHLRKQTYLLFLFLSILARAFGDSVFILDGYYNYCFYYFFILASMARAGQKIEVERVVRPEPVPARA